MELFEKDLVKTLLNFDKFTTSHSPIYYIFVLFLEKISFNEINNIIKYRCGVCHSIKPTFEGFENPPLGIIFDTSKDILINIR